MTEGDLVLESIDFRVALADLYARTGLQRPLGYGRAAGTGP